MADFYQLLGVPRDADGDQIKKAYRKLALEHHPDRNQGSSEAEERFKEVTRAYEVLRDPEKRSAYDRFGEQGLRGTGTPWSSGFEFNDALEVFMRDFGGFGGFSEIFGRGGGRARGAGQRQGSGVRVRLPLDLRDVAHGVTKTVRIALLEPCDRCDGSGAQEGSSAMPCPTCGGAGEERVVQRSVFGQLVAVQPCRRCGGEGRVIEQPCPTCHGEGRIREKKEVKVEVPAGVSSENYITLRGQGSVGPRGGPRGDIVVLLEVEEDRRFTREGNHLVFELPVTFAQAALGGEVDVPTVDASASISMKIPPGCQSGTVLRIRGEGLPDIGDGDRGDLLVRIVVWTPTHLTDEQEEIVRRLREIEDPAPERIDPERGGFWSKVKEVFGAG